MDADGKNVDLAGYVFEAAPEETRSPRVVRIGAIQNKIVLPTTASIVEQVQRATVADMLH